ncbi:Glycerol kinase OS=Streptomyces antimycoticus OX=68175 GN=glpK2_1 PE=3 SV=1 [Streptomyces antimycoticus]
MITGLTRYVTKAHLARAVLESTSWQTREVVDAMYQDSGVRISSLKVDGGMTANGLLMQHQADVLGVPGDPAGGRRDHLSGRGVRGGAGHRRLAGPRRAAGPLEAGHRVDPGDVPEEERTREYGNWRMAVERSFGWHKEGQLAEGS